MQELGGGSTDKCAEATPVFMVHGLLVDNLSSWYFGAGPRLAEDRRVVLYDLRGHGRSQAERAGYDVASGAADLSALVGELSSGPVHVVGHSWGALVALRFALDHPDRVVRLGLVEAPLPPSRLEEMRSIAEANPAELLKALPEGLRDSLLSGRRRAAKARKSLQFLLAETSLVADLAAEPDVDDSELNRLACPVQLIYGSQSSCLPVGSRLLGAIPQASLQVLEGGHYLSLERAAEVGEILQEFLRG